MQGRLSNGPKTANLDWFPFEKWEKEFHVAAKIGFNYIELVLDKYSDMRNPLLNINLIRRMHLSATTAKVKTTNCCINSIINKSLIINDEMEKIKRILKISGCLGINKIILPLFDASKPSKENFSNLVKNIREIAEEALDLEVSVLIESNMARCESEQFFEHLKTPNNIGMVYDLGNMTHCGYDVIGDLDYFFDLIKLVHVKDKDNNGINVRLGTGSVDFVNILRNLDNKNYEGEYTLETARGNDALNEAALNLRYVKSILRQ